jgi:YHS domain-containing protein/thiol-disulfide isomerase/thioredoxin
MARAWMLVGALWLCAPTVSAADNVWRTDFDTAYAEAIKLRRPMLIHFFGQYCPPCKRMEREVLHQPEMTALLAAQFVAVMVDAGDAGNTRGMQLVHRFSVHSLPCDIIVDPLNGRLLSQVDGFQELNRYRTTAVRSRAIFDRDHAVMVVQDENQKFPPIGQQPPIGPELEPQDSNVAETQSGPLEPILGLEGFSPVALGAHRQWIVGSPSHAFEFKGITYYMASAEELDAFRSRPDHFAPRLLGCDPVVLLETDRAVHGSTDYGAFYDGDLYLFESAESRRRFKSEPTKYTRIQHVLRIDNLPRFAQSPEEVPIAQ